MATKVIHNTKYDYAAAWLLFLAGGTLEEVGEMCHIPYGTLVHHASGHFWGKRRTHAKATAFKSVNIALAERIQVHRAKHQNYMLDQLEKTQEHIEGMEIAKTPQEVKEGKASVGHLLNLVDQHDTIARRTLKLDEDLTANPLEQGFAFLVALGKQAGIPQQAFVNEMIEDAEIIEEPNTQKVDDSNGTGEAKNEPEITPSAISPLPDDSEAPTSQLSPKLAIWLGRTDAEMTSQPPPPSEDIGQAGETPIKPMPITLTFKAPTPIVNETNENTPTTKE